MIKIIFKCECAICFLKLTESAVEGVLCWKDGIILFNRFTEDDSNINMIFFYSYREGGDHDKFD